MSRRTDRSPAQQIRELPDAEYGEAATYRDLQQQAPLAQDQGGAASTGAAQALANVIPMDAPTQQPGTPVTDGSAAGAGAGVESLGLVPQTDQDYALLQDDLAVLEFMAMQPGASWATRNLVRRIKGSMS